MSASDTRAKIVQVCEESKPLWKQVHEHSAAVAALSLEYHRESLREALGIEMRSGMLVATLDIRNSPKSLDTTIGQLKMSGVTGLEAIHDLQSGQVFLFKV